MKSETANVAEALRSKIESRTARVGIVGLGYVGLPLAVEFASAGFHVTGIDVQEDRVATLNRGISTSRMFPLARSDRWWRKGNSTPLPIFPSFPSWIR